MFRHHVTLKKIHKKIEITICFRSNFECEIPMNYELNIIQTGNIYHGS